MLNQIQRAKSPTSKPESVVDLLIGCHERIRHFSSLATKLAHAQASAPSEVSTSADSVYRYFAVALPLHEADEEQTMRPRLEAAGDELVRQALVAMGDQHQAIDDLLERLLPLLKLVGGDPAKLHEAGGEMCSISSALEKLFAAHLQLEEEVIFPAIDKKLPSGQRDEMLAEMQHRRKPGQ